MKHSDWMEKKQAESKARIVRRKQGFESEYSQLDTRSLTDEQHKQLMELNTRLMRIEQELMNRARPLINALDEELKLESGWMTDYNCVAVLTFYLGKDDPDYCEDDDNILAELDEFLDFGNGMMLADGQSYNIFEFNNDHPMRGQFHCWLYHCLYDHTRLEWSDLLRIRDIWIDITVDYQRHEKY